MQLHFRDENTVERNLHGVHPGLIQRKVDHGDDRQVHLERRVGTRGNVQFAVRGPQHLLRRVHPREAESVGTLIVGAALQPHHEMGARMHRWKSTDSKRVEDAEDVELSFLRKVGAVGEYSERDMHGQKVEVRAGTS